MSAIEAVDYVRMGYELAKQYAESEEISSLPHPNAFASEQISHLLLNSTGETIDYGAIMSLQDECKIDLSFVIGMKSDVEKTRTLALMQAGAITFARDNPDIADVRATR